jgi:hypothetical protein
MVTALLTKSLIPQIITISYPDITQYSPHQKKRKAKTSACSNPRPPCNLPKAKALRIDHLQRTVFLITLTLGMNLIFLGM